MKVLIVLVLFATLGIMFFQYSQNKEMKKLLISLLTFAAIIAFSIVGNLTRPVMPIFIAHIMLLFVSWGGLIFYLARGRYYWWLIFSPAVTIALFLVLEFLAGSGSETV